MCLLAADHLVDVVLVREGQEGWRDPPAEVGAAEEARLQVKRGLLLDAVVGHGAAVLQLRPREDEPLLVRGDTCTHTTIGRAQPQMTDQAQPNLSIDGLLFCCSRGQGTHRSKLSKLRRRSEREVGVSVPSLSWIFALTVATVSPISTSRMTVFPASVFTRTCIIVSSSAILRTRFDTSMKRKPRFGSAGLVLYSQRARARAHLPARPGT